MNQGTSGGGIVGSTHNASTILGKNLTDMTVRGDNRTSIFW